MCTAANPARRPAHAIQPARCRSLL